MDQEEDTQPQPTDQETAEGQTESQEGGTQATASSFGETPATGDENEGMALQAEDGDQVEEEEEESPFMEGEERFQPQYQDNTERLRQGSVSPGPVDMRSPMSNISQRTDRSNRSAYGAGGGLRRGDIHPTGMVDRYLQSAGNDTTGEIRPTSHAALSSAPDEPINNNATDPVIWGTTINIEDSMAMFKDFITNFKEEGAENYFYPFYLEQLKQNMTYSMNLDCMKLSSFDGSKKLALQLVRYPQEIIPLMDHVLTDFFVERFDDGTLPQGVILKVRPFNLPVGLNLRELDPENIDQLVTVKGLMIRGSPIIPDLKQAFFRCSACDYTIEVENDRGRLAEPTACENPDCRSRNTMVLIHNRCLFADKQVCRLQETPDETPDGQTPYTVSLCCYDDLVDVCKPGDRVEVTGIFRAVTVRTNPRRRSVKTLFKTYVDIVHVKRTSKRRVGVDASIVADNEFKVTFDEVDAVASQFVENEEELIAISQEKDVYELLSRSIAPSIFGLDDVKKGVLLQLFGGAHKFTGNKPGSPRIRGDINILLVGDPGVSKSQLLQYVHKLAPRGVYTSGKGSSAVGLTAYVTRDPDTRQLVLESGALVLSDGGVCCIDEFDKMSDFTRSVLHEVMEQQTISVAKAGIITTLNARTSILASANPINSKFDVRLSVPENVNLPPPLMSRFDLLYLILDKPNERDDRKLAQHLVSLYLTDRPEISTTTFIPVEKFTRYINYARKITPVISESAGQALINFYVSMRKSGSIGGSNVVAFTTRQLESMIRLSEGHAKMRLSHTVERQDVEEANRLVLSALQASAVDPRTGRIDLDLVTTGISAWGRQVHELQRKAIRGVIEEFEKTQIGWPELYRAFLQQSDEALTETDFTSILRDLVDENFIHMSNNRNNAEKVIRKLRV